MELPTATLSGAPVRPTRHTLCTIANGAIGRVVSGSRQLECGTQALGPVHGLVGHGQYTGEGIGMGWEHGAAQRRAEHQVPPNNMNGLFDRIRQSVGMVVDLPWLTVRLEARRVG